MNSQDKTILVVEDSDEDFEILSVMFERQKIPNPLVRIGEGDLVLPYLKSRVRDQQELPGLIILDLNIVSLDGKEVLKSLKSDPDLRHIPVTVYSTSANAKDVQACYALGASSYSVKPVDFHKFEDFVESLKKFWLNHVILPSHVYPST